MIPKIDIPCFAWNSQAEQGLLFFKAKSLMTTGNRKMSQREAAVEAVKKIGLNQRAEIKDEWFEGREKEREMFWCRFGILKEQ